MSFFDRFFGRAAARAGEALAEEVARRYPLPEGGGGLPRISAERLARILENQYAQAQRIRDEHHLGWFGKARLAHAFRWRLTDLGYPKEFVEMATEGLVVYLHKPLSVSTELDKAWQKPEQKANRAKGERPNVTH